MEVLHFSYQLALRQDRYVFERVLAPKRIPLEALDNAFAVAQTLTPKEAARLEQAALPVMQPVGIVIDETSSLSQTASSIDTRESVWQVAARLTRRATMDVLVLAAIALLVALAHSVYTLLGQTGLGATEIMALLRSDSAGPDPAR